MAKSKRRFTNFFYILVTLFLVLIVKVQSSEDVTRVRRRIVAMCPPGFQKIRTECYHLSPYPLTWLEAHFECKNKNGKLAEPTRIQDAAIRKFLLSKYPNESDEIFFGGMFDHQAQEWSWGASGQKLNYSSFIGLKKYKSRKSLDYTCTVYNPNRKFRWTPRQCTENHRFICQHKMPKVSEKNRDKVYQRWNVTYPNQFVNEVVMEVRDDNRRNNSGRVRVVSESGEDEFYMKRTPRPPYPNPHRNTRLPVFERPTYNVPTPSTKSPNDVLNDAGSPADNNEILKPTKNPKKKDRTRSKFDREMAKQRRKELSRRIAEQKLKIGSEEKRLHDERVREQERANEEKRLRNERVKEQEEANEEKRLNDERVREHKEANERKRLHEERVREREERIRLEEAARREEEERNRLNDVMHLEQKERQLLENEGRPKKDVESMEFVPEVITEDYKAIEERKIQKQKEVERLNKEIQEKYRKEQEAALAIQKMEQEKHFKELEEKELARRAEDQKRREEREKERQEIIRQNEEAAKRIEDENQREEERRKEEEEYQKRLEKEKAERIQQEKIEKERQEQERREREEKEKRRKAEIKKKIDAEKDDVIEEEIVKKQKEEKKQQIIEKFKKLSPEDRKKFLELRNKLKAKKLTKTANEVTTYDKK